MEDLTQDIFKFSLNDEESPSQGSTSAIADEAGPSSPTAATVTKTAK